MIPQAHVTHWSTLAPWPTLTQVEQDLLLSRLICEIANDEYLGSELVFRGGTCLHKRLISPSRRNSRAARHARGGAVRHRSKVTERQRSVRASVAAG